MAVTENRRRGRTRVALVPGGRAADSRRGSDHRKRGVRVRVRCVCEGGGVPRRIYINRRMMMMSVSKLLILRWQMSLKRWTVAARGFLLKFGTFRSHQQRRYDD